MLILTGCFDTCNPFRTPLLLLFFFLQISYGADATSVSFYGITDTLRPEDEKYASVLRTASDAFTEAEELFDDEAFVERRGWEEEVKMASGDIVYSKLTPNGKMLAVSTILEGHIDAVMEEMWTGIDKLPDWSPYVNYAGIVANLTNHLDILTYGSDGVLIIDGRDIVAARIYRPLPYVAAKPESKGKVRAHLHLLALQLRPLLDNANRTLCDRVAQVDVRGKLPTFLVNLVLPKILAMDTEVTVTHYKEMAEKANSLEK